MTSLIYLQTKGNYITFMICINVSQYIKIALEKKIIQFQYTFLQIIP